MLVYNWWRALEESRAQVVSELSAHAARIVRDIENLQRQSEWILSHMAQRPAIRGLRASACEDELALLTDAHPAFYLVTLWKPDGTLVCSSIPPEPGKPLPRPHRPTFDIGLSTPGLYLSNLFVGPITGQPIATFTYPVRDGDAVAGLLSLPVHLDYFTTFFEYLRIKPGGSVGILDRDGTIVARRPDNVLWRGKSALVVPGVREELRRSGGVVERKSVDGMERILVHQEVPGIGWHAYVGASPDVLFADTRRHLTRGIAAFLAVLGISLASAYLISRGISRPLRQLVRVASAVSGGERTARANASGSGEIAQLAGSLNHMLDALGRSESSLRESEESFRMLAESSPDAIMIHQDLRIVFVNRAMVQLMHASGESDLVGRSSLFMLDTEAAGVSRRRSLRLYAGEPQPRIELVYTRLDGTTVEVEISSAPLRFNGAPAAQVTVRDISARKQAERLLRASMTRARQLSARLLFAEEAERRRIAQDLHDQLGQDLTALKIRLDTLARTVQPPEARVGLLEAAAASGESLQRVRQLSVDLRPPQLDSLGLEAALRAHVERMAALGAVRMHFDARGFEADLSPDVAIVCFRVVQEALTNVMRHSGAANAWIEIRSSGDGVRITVRDDGSGFDSAQILEQGAASGGVGLPGMQERVALVGGTLDIDSKLAQGCVVTATIPISGAGT